MTLNPLEILDKEISISRSRGNSYLSGIQDIRNKMQREGVQYPPDAGPVEVAAAGVQFDNKLRELRNIQVNFSPTAWLMDDLDDLPETKTMLEVALAFLRERHSAYLKSTRQSLLAKIALAFAPTPVAPVDQPPKREPVRGPFGQDELPSLEVALERIAKLVETFPDLKSLAAVVSEMNALNSRLQLPEKRPATAKRQDVGFVVAEHRQAQPDNGYTHRRHRPALPHCEQPDATLPPRAQPLIVGA